MSNSPNSFGNRPGKPARNVGDAPSIGQVARMYKESESRTGRYRQPRGSGEEQKRGLDTKMALIAGIAMLALGAAGIGLFAWSVRAKGQPAAETGAEPGISPARPALLAAPVPEEAELLKLAEDFLAARSGEDLEPLVRPTDRDAAAMAGELAAILKAEGKIISVRYMGPLDSQTVQVEAVVVTFQGKRNRLALLVPDDEDRWRVDFDAFARRVSPPLPELLSGKEITGTVRVFGSPDSYYNGPYKDDKRWACFGMASPDHETLLFGYIPRDSVQYQALMNSLTEPGIENPGRTSKPYSKRLTLEVRHDPAAEPRQFEITRVLSDEWATGKVPLDEKLARPLSAGAE